VLTAGVDRTAFEAGLTEADGPGPGHGTLFDTQAGLAVLRWCAPLLDLPARTDPEAYLTRRAELGPDDVNRRCSPTRASARSSSTPGSSPTR